MNSYLEFYESNFIHFTLYTLTPKSNIKYPVELIPVGGNVNLSTQRKPTQALREHGRKAPKTF